ncbi:MAG: MFS transporter [Gammaproteobacteria bacterium]|nr:MFS transporter [Gammaproteobacteria bacterium]
MNSKLNLDTITINSKPTIIATSVISASASAIFLIMPLLIGVATEELNLSSERAGFIASSYFAGYLLICLSAVFWIQRLNWRTISVFGHALLVIGILAAIATSQYNTILASFFIAGCGGGILFGLCINILGQTDNPDRSFGIKLSAEQILAALLVYLLPLYVIDSWGYTGLGVTLTIVFCVLGFATIWLPSKGNKSEVMSINDSKKSTRAVCLGLLALMIFMSGLSGVWAFIERMADENAISAVDIGKALSFGLIGGVFGAFAAALFGDRFGRVIPLTLSILTLSLVLFILNSNFSLTNFIFVCIALSGFWNYSLAYQMGIVASIDKTGNLTVLISSALALGAMLGPAIAGMLISGDSYLYLHIFAFLCIASAIGLLIFLSAGAHKGRESSAS